MITFTVGTQIQLSSTFRDAGGNLIDPTLVLGEIRTPDGAVSPLVVTRQSQGVYTAPFTPTLPNLHQYRFAGTGAAVAAQEGSFSASTSFG